MKDFWNQFLRLVKALLSLLKVRSPEERLHERGINEAVERVVDQVNPRLRAVGGYRKRLYPVVERAMVHTRELAQQVPGPIQLPLFLTPSNRREPAILMCSLPIPPVDCIPSRT